MGSGLSSIAEEPYLQGMETRGVQSLVREIGLNIIPAHIRHSYDSILQILEVIRKLQQFDQESYNGFLLMLVALVRHAQNQTAVSVSNSIVVRILPLSPLSCSAIFKRDEIFARYAVEIYAASWKTELKDISTTLGIDEDDIIMKWFEDDMEEHCPKFVVFVDHKEHSVVLVIRGTFSFKDAIMDIVCEEQPFLGGFAHKGLLDGSTKVLSKSRRVLENSLRDNFGYNLVLVGHSMGGGTAELITLKLLMSPGLSLLPPGVGVRCVSLGAPPVFRGEVPIDVQDKISIYINNRDVVPRLSLGSVAKLLAMLRAVDNLAFGIEQQLAVLMWREGDEVKENRRKVVEAVKVVRQENFPYLDHPGHVIRLTTSSSGVKISRETDTGILAANMEIFETMITDHIHTTYRDTFTMEVL